MIEREDSFYLNIPAYKIERLENGSIMVILYEDPDAPLDVAVKATKKAIDYYKQELTKMGLWGKLKWWTDWREKNRGLLEKHNIVLPEW